MAPPANPVDNCPRCGKGSHVVDSRSLSKYGIKRRRECLTCRWRYTTYEVHDVEQRGVKALHALSALNPEAQQTVWNAINALVSGLQKLEGQKKEKEDE